MRSSILLSPQYLLDGVFGFLETPWKVLWPQLSLDVIFYFAALFGARLLCIRLVNRLRERGS